MHKLTAILFFSLFSLPVMASHLLGGDMTAQHIGGDNYRITATLYRDCNPANQGGGNPAAIVADNPMFISIFDLNRDGTFKGQEQAIDAYYWVAVVQDKENKNVIFKGDVTIIR